MEDLEVNFIRGTWLGFISVFVGLMGILVSQEGIGYILAPMFFLMILFLTKGRPDELVYLINWV